MDISKENKSAQPAAEKKVKVKINQGRAIKGVGKAGDVVEMAETIAKQYERDGYVTFVKEK